MTARKSQLIAKAAEFDPPLKLRSSWTAPQIAKAIRERRREDKRTAQTEQGKGPQPAGPQPGPQPAGPQPGPQPANLDFESAAGAPAEPPKSKVGGWRPGSGRPQGMTDEKAKVKNLPQQPAAPIKQGVQALFDLWASAAKLEQLALDETEAHLLALPLTQLQEFYFPGLLPEIAGTWIMLIFAATKVVKPRLVLIAEVRKAREKGVDVNQVLKEVKIDDAKTGHKSNNGKDRKRQDRPGTEPAQR